MSGIDWRPVQPAAPVQQAAGRRVVRAAIWVPGLAVAIGAAVATAHGLYEVAIAARVPAGIAWLYPLITDGLALVAYAATARLSGSARSYAWAVVILAAGLSGLAQAAYLAGAGPTTAEAADPTSVAGFVAPPAELRFGVGAWPAIAAAIVAHLLYLLATDRSAERPSAAQRPASSVRTTGVQPYSAVSSSNGHSAANTTRAESVDTTVDVQSSEPSTRPLPSVALPSAQALDAPARDRARTVARSHADQHGAWPTVTQLMALAEVSRGTAGHALKHLREKEAAPNPTTDTDQNRTPKP